MRLLDPSVLRSNDIRGIVGETLQLHDALPIGQAIARLARAKGCRRIAVCYDGRLTSPDLEAGLVAGLRNGGIDVLRLGRGPTPLLYYAAYSQPDVDGGVMVTGSHAPADRNGFKIVLGRKALTSEEVLSIGRLAEETEAEHGQGKVQMLCLREGYMRRLLHDSLTVPPLKIAWDPGHGAVAEILRRLVMQLPGEHHLINAEIDGRFPGRNPDPTVADNLAAVRALVLERKLDLGLAFDGDGDRLGVVDAEGEVIWADQIILLLARDILRRHPGARVVADVKMSQDVFDGVRALGGKAVMCRSGHAHVKQCMLDNGALLAGEMSAHFFFADRYYGYDDALYAAIRLLSALGLSGQSLADFRRALPRKAATPMLYIPCPEERKAALMAAAVARLRTADVQVDYLDGVRVTQAEGWWLLRASNTEAVLTARCEAARAEDLPHLMGALQRLLADIGVDAPLL